MMNEQPLLAGVLIVQEAIRVTVEFVGALAAKVWRAPDASFPRGVSYGVRLSEITGPRQVRIGDILEAHVDERGKVLKASIVGDRAVSAGTMAHA